MAKRQTRYFQDEIHQNITKLIHVNANIVLQNKSVIFGKVIMEKAGIIVVRNMMGHRLKLHLQDIRELWIDHEA